jgi:NADH-quinone oxidoreductase subunit N
MIFSIFRLLAVKEVFLYNETVRCGLLLTTFFILRNSTTFIEKHPSRPLSEYSFFVISSLCFLLVLIEANDFLVLFAGLLGFSITLYVLIMMFWTTWDSQGATEEKELYFFESYENAHEASLKYFYMSAFSSSLILLSSAIFYTMTQTASFDELQLIIAKPSESSGFDWLLVWKKLFWLALALYTIGFAFKLSAFPSYFWAPEVYYGSANPVTAFIIMPVKLAVFAIFTRTLMTTFELFHTFWGPMLLFFGLGSLVVGALGALTERVFKKFLAYSSINQIGFVLIALATGQITGLQSGILFFILYVLTSLALFAVFLNLEDDRTRWSIRYTTDLGLISPQEWLPRLAFSFVFFSLAGLPPFAGFFGKFYVLLHLFQEGYWLTVLVGVLSSVISAYYYLSLIALLWFGSTSKWISKDQESSSTVFISPYRATWDEVTKGIVLLILGFLLAFVLVNEPLLNFCRRLAYSCAYHTTV